MQFECVNSNHSMKNHRIYLLYKLQLCRLQILKWLLTKFAFNPLHFIKIRQIENRKRIRTKTFDVQNICKHDLHFCYHGCNFGAKCKLEKKKIKDDALPLLFWPPCLCRDYVRLRLHNGINFVKFSFSEKTTKICEFVLMVLTSTK